MGSETTELENMLSGLKTMEKDLSKMTKNLGGDLEANFQKIMSEHIYEGEKKGKVNKKNATMQLAKDGSIRIVFEDMSDGKKLFENFK